MEHIKRIIEEQRIYFEKGETKDIKFRIEQLKRLKAAVVKNESEIMEALKKDLNKSGFEAYVTEIGIVLEEINYIIKHLPKWAKRKRIKTPITQFFSTTHIYSEPYGVVLIMAPWNYPFQLAIAPLIGAIAAGNCSIIKPSEYSIETTKVLSKIIEETFSEEYVSVITGELEVNKALLEEKFDYIFFTGSVEVGKIVMKAASKYLTPVTLELGGKSPCIVDESADIALAAKRIAWGKFINAGQTCVAPDYLLVHKSVKEKLISEMKDCITEFYGNEPYNNEEYPSIINEKHANRLMGLIQGEKLVCGGQYNEKTNQLAPTILDNISWDSAVMQEEIFGPILPILEFEALDKVISMVNARPKPLALYYFTTNKAKEKNIINSISFGGGCINDTIMHLATSNMAFGGVGESGMGAYHGKASFDTFSHKKGILKKYNFFDMPLRYPPYKNNLKLLKKVMK